MSQPASVQFDFGRLTQTVLNPLLNTLPIEITFIDDTETVLYFDNPPKMIFLRTKGVIGMKVQNCHLSKNLDTGNKISQSFKSAKKSVVEFWITSHERMLYIRFFTVKDTQVKYLGWKLCRTSLISRCFGVKNGFSTGQIRGSADES